jgi:hypothetical protein
MGENIRRSPILFAVELAMALWAEAYRQTDEAHLRCAAYGMRSPSRQWCWDRVGVKLYELQIPRVKSGAVTGIGIVRGEPVFWRRGL